MRAEVVADNGAGSLSTTCDDLEISRKKKPSWLGRKRMGDSAERNVAGEDGTNRSRFEEVKRVLEGVGGLK